MKKFLTVVVVIIIIIILVGGYYGLVPGVSSFFGSDKPKDLGVVASVESFKSGIDKVGLVRDDSAAATSKSITYEGSHPVNISLSSEEITSLTQSGSWKPTWSLNPIADKFEMKISPNGTVEVSGLVDMNKLNGYLSTTGYKDVQSYLSKFNFLPNKIPFYASGTGSITNNKVTLNINSAELGRIPLPVDPSSLGDAANFVEREISQIPGMSVTSANFSGGKLNFKGTYPSKIKF
jgi:hypothetical protein